MLGALRALAPEGPLAPRVARAVTEGQAKMLLAIAGVTAPPVPASVVAEVPSINVRRWRGLPVSGMAIGGQTGWEIVLDADESQARQRMTLLHEFKHVIDDPAGGAARYPATTELGCTERAERACNYFAACVLMPEAWLRADWNDGQRDVRALARRYRVSKRAMRYRLAEIGLLAPEPGDRALIGLLASRQRQMACGAIV